jgi:hypothetical protein
MYKPQILTICAVIIDSYIEQNIFISCNISLKKTGFMNALLSQTVSWEDLILLELTHISLILVHCVVIDYGKELKISVV